MRPTNTVSNEQQDGRGSSVITPLPAGGGGGGGGGGRLYFYDLRNKKTAHSFIFIDRMTE